MYSMWGNDDNEGGTRAYPRRTMKCVVKPTGSTKPCGQESGENIVCDFHRKTMSKTQRARADEAWHDFIVSRAMIDIRSGVTFYQCYHCKGEFPRNSVCGDHFPYTKGSRPDLRYSINNGVPCCKSCNQSDSPHRRGNLPLKG